MAAWSRREKAQREQTAKDIAAHYAGVNKRKGGSLRWTDEQYRAYVANHNHLAFPPADLERDAEHAAKAQNARQKVGERVRIQFHSKRRRSIDPDGLYAKAAIDGLTEGGILIDDSAAYVESVSYTQEFSEIEETIITVEAHSTGGGDDRC